MTFFPDSLPPIQRTRMEVDGEPCILYLFRPMSEERLAELETFIAATHKHELLEWNDVELAPQCVVRLSDVRRDVAIHVCAFIIHDGGAGDPVNRQ